MRTRYLRKVDGPCSLGLWKVCSENRVTCVQAALEAIETASRAGPDGLQAGDAAAMPDLLESAAGGTAFSFLFSIRLFFYSFLISPPHPWHRRHARPPGVRSRWRFFFLRPFLFHFSSRRRHVRPTAVCSR